MSVAWPAALPMPQFGLRYNVVDPQRRTQMASGRDMVRRRFSDVPTEFSARWMLSGAEAELFEQFYQDDLVDGSEWIEMPLVTAQGEGVHFVRFRGAYRYRRVGDDLWEYSAELQMYLRADSGIDPPGLFPAPPSWVPNNAINITYNKSGYFSPWQIVGLGIGGNASCQAGSTATSCIPYIIDIDGEILPVLAATLASARSPSAGNKFGYVTFERTCIAPVTLKNIYAWVLASTEVPGSRNTQLRFQINRRPLAGGSVAIHTSNMNLHVDPIDSEITVTDANQSFGIGDALQVYMRFNRDAFAGSQPANTLGLRCSLEYLGFTTE